jgi:hypothetical protein
MTPINVSPRRFSVAAGVLAVLRVEPRPPASTEGVTTQEDDCADKKTKGARRKESR